MHILQNDICTFGEPLACGCASKKGKKGQTNLHFHLVEQQMIARLDEFQVNVLHNTIEELNLKTLSNQDRFL